MRTASLLLVLAAGAQEPRTIDQIAAALATASGEEEIDRALKGLDAQSASSLEMLRREAVRQGPPAEQAARRHLPSRAWTAAQYSSTVGVLRRSERELLGPAAKDSPEAYGRAVAKLLASEDAKQRLLALRVFEHLQAPEPKDLLPFLKEADVGVATAAANALARSGWPGAGAELVELMAADPRKATIFAFSGFQAIGPESLPRLLELLKTYPGRAASIVRVLAKVADARAEEPLLELLDAPGADPDSLAQTIAAVGGERSMTALRAALEKAPPESPARTHWIAALVALRAPGTAERILAERAAGRVRLHAVKAWLERLGDPAAVPALVEIARAKETRIDDRRAALELLGTLGAVDARELLEASLADPRFADAAAAGLAELADPRSARPLAVALRNSQDGTAALRALQQLPAPLVDVDAPLLEILDDPQGHKTASHALRVAARVKSARLKAILLRRLVEGDSSIWGGTALALALIPQLEEADAAALAPAAGSESSNGVAVDFALASLGLEASLRRTLTAAAQGRINLESHGHPPGLASWPLPEGAVVRLLPEILAANPKWLDGAEALALRGKPDGRDLLLGSNEPGNRHDAVPRALEALLRLDGTLPPDMARRILGNPERYAGSDAIGAALDDAAADALRARVFEDVKEIGYSPVARLLARRGDALLEPFMIPLLRAAQNEVYANLNDDAFAAAAARRKLAEARPIFLRWLRTPWPTRRAIAIRSLAAYGDPADVALLAPFLDDAELRSQERGSRPWNRTPRVRDAALQALSSLAGRPFASIAAAKAWAAAK